MNHDDDGAFQITPNGTIFSYDGNNTVIDSTQLTGDEFKANLLVCTTKVAPHVREFFRCGILKRIDRLLLVADRENGAVRGSRASAGKKLGA